VTSVIECESHFNFLWSKISDFRALFPQSFALLSCLCVVKESVFAWDVNWIWVVPVRGWFNPLLAVAPSWISVSRSNHSTWFSPPFPRSEVFLFPALVFVVCVKVLFALCWFAWDERYRSLFLPTARLWMEWRHLVFDLRPRPLWSLYHSFNFAQLLGLLRALGHTTQARCSADQG
jgi:hypothetical protein